jgi:hypothetical protein
MDRERRSADLGLSVLGVALAAGIVLSAILVSSTIKDVKMANQTIVVKGYAQKEVKSDIAVWSGRFTSRDPDLVTAYARLERDLKVVVDYMGRSGIPEENISVSAVSTRIQNRRTPQGYETNEIEQYVLEQTVSVSSNDVDLVSSLSRESTILIREGIEFFSYSPEYYYSKIEDMKIQLLGEATLNARQRAEQLAVNSGGKVGPLRAATQGVFQITPVYSTDVDDWGRYDTTTINKAVKAVVTIQYSID